MCSYSLSSDMRLSMQQDDSRFTSGTATLSFCPGDTLCKRIHISTRAVGPERISHSRLSYLIAHGCASRRDNATAWSCRRRVHRGTRGKEKTTVDNKKARRKTRCDKGQIQLTDRDLWVLHWIAEQYAARLDQVQNLLGQEA